MYVGVTQCDGKSGSRCRCYLCGSLPPQKNGTEINEQKWREEMREMARVTCGMAGVLMMSRGMIQRISGEAKRKDTYVGINNRRVCVCVISLGVCKFAPSKTIMVLISVMIC